MAEDNNQVKKQEDLIPKIHTLLLDGNWTLSKIRSHIDFFTEDDKKYEKDVTSVNCVVPGIIQIDLLREKIIDEPYCEYNEKKLHWMYLFGGYSKHQILLNTDINAIGNINGK